MRLNDIRNALVAETGLPRPIVRKVLVMMSLVSGVAQLGLALMREQKLMHLGLALLCLTLAIIWQSVMVPGDSVETDL